jgi:hypothetical protein
MAVMEPILIKLELLQQCFVTNSNPEHRENLTNGLAANTTTQMKKVSIKVLFYNFRDYAIL